MRYESAKSHISHHMQLRLNESTTCTLIEGQKCDKKLNQAQFFMTCLIALLAGQSQFWFVGLVVAVSLTVDLAIGVTVSIPSKIVIRLSG